MRDHSQSNMVIVCLNCANIYGKLGKCGVSVNVLIFAEDLFNFTSED